MPNGIQLNGSEPEAETADSGTSGSETSGGRDWFDLRDITVDNARNLWYTY